MTYWHILQVFIAGTAELTAAVLPYLPSLLFTVLVVAVFSYVPALALVGVAFWAIGLIRVAPMGRIAVVFIPTRWLLVTAGVVGLFLFTYWTWKGMT